jgi:2-polyprenyl-3-methyl-5-hydroxy-6-metoxy-1,4-benzoquinol methylase
MAKENEDSYYLNYLNCNQRLLKSVPEGLGSVLEFGCSGGMLGKTYKQDNPDTVWHGVDIHKPAIDYAKTMIDEAWCMNANQLKANDIMQKSQYDALVYGDVIEHLIAPEDSLPTHLKLLKSGGKVIICIPNVQHWSVMKHVLSGNWTYSDQGILDRTHLRFFTRKSFVSFLDGLSLNVVSMERLSYENTAGFIKQASKRARMLKSLEDLCSENNIPYSDYDFRTFQYIFIAEKS